MFEIKGIISISEVTSLYIEYIFDLCDQNIAETARKLECSPKTVKNHLRSHYIRRNFDANNEIPINVTIDQLKDRQCIFPSNEFRCKYRDEMLNRDRL